MVVRATREEAVQIKTDLDNKEALTRHVAAAYAIMSTLAARSANAQVGRPLPDVRPSVGGDPVDTVASTPAVGPVAAPEAAGPVVAPSPMAPAVGTRKADPIITEAAENVTPKAGRFDIAVHADQKSFWVRTGPGKNDWAKIPTNRVADFMRSMGYTGGPVRLIACESGALPTGPAQKLANELGNGVLAPTDKVWIHPDGRLTIGATPYKSTGKWVWFAPEK